jgi:hypothetical protein
VYAKGFLTAGVPAGSVMGIVGLPIPLRGTGTVILPFAPGVKVPVTLLDELSWLLVEFHGPQAYEIVAASTLTLVP